MQKRKLGRSGLEGGNAAPVAAARKQAPTKPISTRISEMTILAPYSGQKRIK